MGMGSRIEMKSEMRTGARMMERPVRFGLRREAPGVDLHSVERRLRETKEAPLRLDPESGGMGGDARGRRWSLRQFEHPRQQSTLVVGPPG